MFLQCDLVSLNSLSLGLQRTDGTLQIPRAVRVYAGGAAANQAVRGSLSLAGFPLASHVLHSVAPC